MSIFLKPESTTNWRLRELIGEYTHGTENNQTPTVIANCARCYAKINHRSHLHYFCYRVTQIFMAIVGQSDWQKAQKCLIKLLKGDPDTIVDSIQIKNEKQWKYLANGMLSTFVELYQTETDPETMRHSPNRWRSENVQIINNSLRGLGVDFQEKFQQNVENSNFVFTIFPEKRWEKTVNKLGNLIGNLLS